MHYEVQEMYHWMPSLR